MHLRAIPRRHRQEIAGGPSPARLALDALHTVAAEALCRVIGIYGLNALHNKAGRLVLLDGNTAVRHHNCIFLQGGAAFCQNAREYKQFHTAGQILHGRKRHQRVGFRGHDLVPYDGADQCDILVVELLCILPQQLGDRTGGHLSDLTAVGVQRARTVFAALRTRLQDRTGTRKVLHLIVTAAVTLALCGVAWGLLAAADANFAALGQQVSNWWNRLLNNVRFIDQLMYILPSLPVGAWLYGLVGGSLRRKAPPTTAQQCAAVLENCRIVPRTTAVAAVTALCGVYALFFAVQAGEWLAAAPLGLDAPDTAAFAVNGFWELLKILLLDFSVLAGIQFFGRAPLPKALAAVFCGFGVAFAALAAGKLAVYVTLCALTPRRFTAAWCLFVLAVCAVLALVRVFRPIPAAKLAIFAAAVSFTLLCCVNVKQRVIDVNLARYEAGIDEELDWGVLWECGYKENAAQ